MELLGQANVAPAGPSNLTAGAFPVDSVGHSFQPLCQVVQISAVPLFLGKASVKLSPWQEELQDREVTGRLDSLTTRGLVDRQVILQGEVCAFLSTCSCKSSNKRDSSSISTGLD